MKMNDLTLIACVDRKWGIGKNGGLLFHIKRDMARFKEMTMDNIVIMGRGTLNSLPGGEPLVGRVNIVLTRDTDFSRAGVIPCHTLDELQAVLESYREKKPFVIGGGEIYRLLLPYCSAAYITRVDTDGGADVFMPNLDAAPDWRPDGESPAFTENGERFVFRSYSRCNARRFEKSEAIEKNFGIN